jgi:hypothetical protein
MRRPLAFLFLALLVAAPAAAQEKRSKPTKVIRPSPLAGLRSAAAPDFLAARTGRSPTAPPPLASPVATPIATLALPLALPFTPQANEPGQCRIACAQSYYFCLAGDDAETCAPSWGQCLSTCTGPPLTPPLASTIR